MVSVYSIAYLTLDRVTCDIISAHLATSSFSGSDPAHVVFATTLRRLLGTRLCCLVLHQPNRSVSKLQHFSQSDNISGNCGHFTNCLMLTHERILSPRVCNAHGGGFLE